MSAVAARTPARRRGGRRVLIVLVIVVLLVGGGIFWLNSTAQAAVNVSGTLTVYQPTTSLDRGSSGTFADATSGTRVHAGGSVKTDVKGRASIQLPDGTLTRLASNTQSTLDAAPIRSDAPLHD